VKKVTAKHAITPMLSTCTYIARRGLFFPVTSTVCMHSLSSVKAFVLCCGSGWSVLCVSIQLTLSLSSLKRIFEDAVVSVEAPATATAASLAASAADASAAAASLPPPPRPPTPPLRARRWRGYGGVGSRVAHFCHRAFDSADRNAADEGQQQQRRAWRGCTGRP
jgi:hypothetical protein